jgi:hypothetical protein
MFLFCSVPLYVSVNRAGGISGVHRLNGTVLCCVNCLWGTDIALCNCWCLCAQGGLLGVLEEVGNGLCGEYVRPSVRPPVGLPIL